MGLKWQHRLKISLKGFLSVHKVMEKEERKVIQRLWEDIVCRVGACLRAFVCIKRAFPPQGPSGDIYPTSFTCQGRGVLPLCSALPNATASPASRARKTPAELRDVKGIQELVCVIGLMPLPRWRCPYFSHTTFHSPGLPKLIHPTAGHSEEGLTSPTVTAEVSQGLVHMDHPI